MPNVEVRVSGPVLTGRGPVVVAEILRDAQHAAAASGVAFVRAVVDRSARHPTGHYRGQVRIDRQANDLVINDGGIIYGPWLEGIAGRNYQTGFAGYHQFRAAAQQLDRRMPQIIDAAVARGMRRLS